MEAEYVYKNIYDVGVLRIDEKINICRRYYLSNNYSLKF